MYTPQRLTCNLFTQCYNLNMIFRDDPDVPERDNSLYKGECVSVLTFIIGLVILIGVSAKRSLGPTTARRLPTPRKTALTSCP